MTHRSLIIAAAFALSLAACGGSGSGVTPNPGGTAAPTQQPTQTPKTYTIAITYKGGLMPNGSTVQSVYGQSVGTKAASPAAVPVMLVAPDSTSSQAQYGVNATGALVTADVEPSPSPAVSTAPAWSVNTADVAIQTPQPADPASLQSNVAVPVIATTGACTISVSIGDPVNGSQSIPCYVYPRLTLWCPHVAPASHLVPSEIVQGVAFDANGNAVPQNDPSVSDVYVDGPNCYGAFQNAAEAAMTLHFAHGGTALPGGWSTLPFYTVTASQFANTTQAVTVDSSTYGNTYVFQDAIGRAVKYEPNSYGSDSSVSEGNFSGGFQVAGASVDGF